ncbi:MAG: FtsX-like permease family protein [Bryobacteraceae bacterium]|nr:FtsX-like permease family protein [Bryobacteraceae bacterium]
MSERISKSLLSRKALVVLCLIFAGLALILAAVGIYGVLAYTTSQRTRELGIRMALGATVENVLSMIISQGLWLAFAGLVIGAFGAVFVTRLMTSMLYEVKPTDPLVYLAVALVLGVVAFAASLIPSLRAVRIQPSSALRYE